MVTAQTFLPLFREDVTVTIGDRTSGVNFRHCLKDPSAVELADVLAAAGRPCGIVRGPSGEIIGHPITYKGALAEDKNGKLYQTGLGATASAAVPYLIFVDGTIVNAGLLAAYWLNNPPESGQKYNIALKHALIDIEQEAANQGFITPDDAAERIKGITGENK